MNKKMAEAVERAKREALSDNARKGGKARAAALTPERRKAIAQQAIRARWAKREKDEGEQQCESTNAR